MTNPVQNRNINVNATSTRPRNPLLPKLESAGDALLRLAPALGQNLSNIIQPNAERNELLKNFLAANPDQIDTFIDAAQSNPEQFEELFGKDSTSRFSLMELSPKFEREKEILRKKQEATLALDAGVLAAGAEKRETGSTPQETARVVAQTAQAIANKDLIEITTEEKQQLFDFLEGLSPGDRESAFREMKGIKTAEERETLRGQYQANIDQRDAFNSSEFVGLPIRALINRWEADAMTAEQMSGAIIVHGVALEEALKRSAEERDREDRNTQKQKDRDSALEIAMIRSRGETGLTANEIRVQRDKIRGRVPGTITPDGQVILAGEDDSARFEDPNLVSEEALKAEFEILEDRTEAFFQSQLDDQVNRIRSIADQNLKKADPGTQKANVTAVESALANMGIEGVTVEIAKKRSRIARFFGGEAFKLKDSEGKEIDEAAFKKLMGDARDADVALRMAAPQTRMDAYIARQKGEPITSTNLSPAAKDAETAIRGLANPSPAQVGAMRNSISNSGKLSDEEKTHLLNILESPVADSTTITSTPVDSTAGPTDLSSIQPLRPAPEGTPITQEQIQSLIPDSNAVVAPTPSRPTPEGTPLDTSQFELAPDREPLTDEPLIEASIVPLTKPEARKINGLELKARVVVQDILTGVIPPERGIDFIKQNLGIGRDSVTTLLNAARKVSTIGKASPIGPDSLPDIVVKGRQSREGRLRTTYQSLSQDEKETVVKALQGNETPGSLGFKRAKGSISQEAFSLAKMALQGQLPQSVIGE